MSTHFQPIAHSWVAKHPDPVGVVEFIGGALYGTLPSLTYSHFLTCLYDTGYTVIAVPFPMGLNHAAIAERLLTERDSVRAELAYSSEIPHLWVGHSLGCKYIALLEAKGKIMNQPSLLMAPDISDTRDALPIPILADLLDRYHLGVTPTRSETQRLICDSRLFNLTALISFQQDNIAGNKDDTDANSDVAWLIQELQNRQGAYFPWAEIPGGHREPIGIRLENVVLNPNIRQFLDPIALRQLEQLAIDFLSKLVYRTHS
ncbi:DUF1350 family protein [Phormidium sp. CLA17]|uniref:DUF1350 family protein n=1 Tax=Leptolyngbya sp. Cla-17 TaxID=2803751 RepID=UPI0014916D3B|nr:DUF1350 family protein [Leptolyngbya sp. Cla-17]MBM0741479.1 DUF1350 family protein [Leptolyngbya sp. Cla-17]